MNSIDKNKINSETSDKSGIQGSRIVLPENYLPTDIEEYMNENHLEFFRQKLLIWKKELLNAFGAMAWFYQQIKRNFKQPQQRFSISSIISKKSNF